MFELNFNKKGTALVYDDSEIISPKWGNSDLDMEGGGEVGKVEKEQKIRI